MKHFLLAFALISTAAWANEPVKPSCTKPEFPGKLASDMQMKTFNRRFKEYGDCMKKFIDEQSAVVKSATDAANLAINDYNAAVKEVQGAGE
ncbi:hypothetical protein [Chitinimonas taiwanensis]|uniref:hypothetical protein n=1 Tax=Chitinimonas taiwanensis TaxID=240412 RepID=UPI00161A8F09